MKQTLNDNLQWDVLACLYFSGSMKLQWKEIRDSLQKKYTQYDKESFEVKLSRALKRLIESGNLKKDDTKHQEVYYFIPKRRQQKVIDGIGKRFLQKKLDEFWDRFSLEQKKKLALKLAQSQSLIIGAERKFIKNFFGLFGDWTKNLHEQLNNPKYEENSSKYSPKERAELSDQLTKLKDDFVKMESNMIAEEKFVAENLNGLMELSLDFQNYIVDPLYNGNGHKAIADLIRKAIEEQKEKTA